MPEITWDGSRDEELQDATGITQDRLGDHRDGYDHGYQYGSLTEGLVAYYPMEESGSTVLHDGALDNLGQITGATWNGSGKVGSDALSFDGTDDSVTTSHNPLSTTVTISLWAKIDSTQNSRKYMYDINASDGGTANSLMRTDGSGSIQTGLRNDAESGWIYINAPYSYDTNWHLYTLTWDGGDGSGAFFVDGSVTESFTSNDSLNIESTQYLQIGESQSGTAPISGSIDDFRIYDRALSQQEIQALYNLTSPSGRLVSESDVPSQSDNGVARYEFNGDVTDSWGSNDGTDNTSAGYVNGVYGQAKDFDGTDDRVELPDLGLSSTNSFTVSVWANTQNDIDNKTLFGRINAGADIVRLVERADNTIKFECGNLNGNLLSVTAGSYQTNEWNHLIGIYNANGPKVQLYLNRSLIAETNGTVDNFDTTDGPWIGGRNDNGQYFNGQIDDVRIYDKALTPQEVEQLYNKGAYRINRSDTL